ncbi:hypothetical protein AB0K02_09495 [Streptomyces sp. NPDC049597]|uniref:hypothetical protein n=1 Tax=Streptomyces sp. NPDC049597 TaxID=3155276 RepID=UPI00344AAAC3
MRQPGAVHPGRPGCPVRRFHESDQGGVRPAPAHHDDGDVPYVRTVEQHRLHLAQFDPVAAQLV